jgi:hypothetical protein
MEFAKKEGIKSWQVWKWVSFDIREEMFILRLFSCLKSGIFPQHVFFDNLESCLIAIFKTLQIARGNWRKKNVGWEII